MDQSINLAELVKPKFNVGDAVWIVARDYQGFIEGVYPGHVTKVKFEVVITKIDNAEVRQQGVTYHVGNAAYGADNLVTSLSELEGQRCAR
ncbi:hypothetical protein [Cupriavidus metallidurans]